MRRARVHAAFRGENIGSEVDLTQLGQLFRSAYWPFVRYSGAMRAVTCVVMSALFVGGQAAVAVGQDEVADARRVYNEGRFDAAIAAANTIWQLSRSDASAVVLARSRLERFRADGQASELEAAHDILQRIDPRSLSPMERTEWELGIAAELYLRDEFGPAAEILDRLLREDSGTGTDRDRLVDWWASAVDHTAHGHSRSDRVGLYERLTDRLDVELARHPTSAAAAYWLVAATRGAGDLQRAWNLAVAGWIRAGSTNAALRTDLDRLVLQGVIPDLAVSRTALSHVDVVTIGVMAQLADDWESVKARWASR